MITLTEFVKALEKSRFGYKIENRGFVNITVDTSRLLLHPVKAC